MSVLEPVVVTVAVEEQSLLQDEDSSRAEGKLLDDDILRRFVSDRDEMAFAKLVERHAAMVMGVCRRALGNEQDAEDAFQATFLVLARKAATVRDASSLPAWLYQTAYRIALRARTRRARRNEQPIEAEVMTESESLSQIATEHDQAILDEELNRLPENYRLVLFLCCVEGKSRGEVAEQLGVSANAIKGRLQRARDVLRRRLLLRGVSLSVAVGLTISLRQTVQATQVVASSLIASTVQAGVQHAAGNAALGFTSPNALSLANGSFPFMSLTTAKIAVCCFCIVGVFAVAGNFVPGADGSPLETINLSSESASVDVNPIEIAIGDRSKANRSSQKKLNHRGNGEGRRSARSQSDERRRGDAMRSGSSKADARRSGKGGQPPPKAGGRRRGGPPTPLDATR